MNEYRNQWYRPGGHDPEIYRTDAKPVEHRGYTIFNRMPGACADVVKDGVCISQRVSVAGAKGMVDLMLDHGHAGVDCLRASIDGKCVGASSGGEGRL